MNELVLRVIDFSTTYITTYFNIKNKPEENIENLFENNIINKIKNSYETLNIEY